ncbi:MAG: hypothetical protein JJU00_04200 [Opitutales bacterium]|nr:hypothetical protein [Opitutales bacterium]
MPLALTGALFAAASLAAADDLAVGHVGTTTFVATWTLPGGPDGMPLAIHYDAAGTEPVGDYVERELYPLDALGTPDRPGGSVERERARAVRGAMEARGRVLVRVGGLSPATTYFVSAGGTEPVPVTTAAVSRWIPEARQIEIAFDALSPEEREGALVRIDVDGSLYPLFTTLLNHPSGGARAVADLTALLDADGITQRAPGGPLEITVSLPDLPLDPLVASIPYDGSFVVAAHTAVLFAPAEPGVAAYVFDPVGPQASGIPFLITIRAVDDSGVTVPGFDGAVELSGILPLVAGGGLTPNFTDGVLWSHSVRVDETGTQRLTAVDGEGRTGESEAFEVVDTTALLTINADPPDGGNMSGAGEYATGALATVAAFPAEGFRFVRWIGEPVDDDSAATTTVLMDGDRFLTAVFRRDTVPAYDDWVVTYFLRDAGNAEVTGLTRDPNRSGLVNLLEFAFGRNPMAAEGDRNLPHLVRGDTGELSFVYYRRAGHPQLEYVIEVSASLDAADWTDHLPAVDAITVESEDGEIERITVNLDLPKPVFARMRVRFIPTEP